MQSLAKTYMSYFEQLTRQKGRQLFQAGRGGIAKNEPGLIRAVCEDGGKKLLIGARVQANELHVHCECAYFQARTGYCRHIWVLLLVADQRGLSSFLSIEGVDDDENRGILVADEIWLTQPGGEGTKKREDLSWRQLIRNVERIRKTQEKILFKPAMVYTLDLIKDDSNRTSVDLVMGITSIDLAPDEGNPFQNVPLERLLPLLKQNDLHIFTMILNNCAIDPMGSERRYRLPISAEPKLVDLLSRVACSVSYSGTPQGILEFEEDNPWEIVLKIEDRGSYSALRPVLVREGKELGLTEVGHFIESYPRGFYAGAKRFTLKDNVDNVWLQALETGSSSYSIPVSGIQEFLTHFSKACSGLHPRVEWPENFWTAVELESDPLAIFQVDFNELGISADLFFEYPMEPPQKISAFSAQNNVLQWGTRKSCDRKRKVENDLISKLRVVPNLLFVEEDHQFHIDHENVHEVLRELNKLNIVLFGKDKKIKTYSRVQLEVSSKVDWFDVKGNIDYDGEKVSLGQMLEAIQNNSRYILLSNGEYGLLPEKWIAKNRHLLEMTERDGDKLQVQKNQFLLLNQITEKGDDDIEIKNTKGLKDLNNLVKMTEDFDGLGESEQPPEFIGEMRTYQLSGLSWLKFLKKFHFGGILADDMGLGKTVQAIASILEELAMEGEKKVNLLIVPTSLIFNWKDEMARFSPTIRVRSYTGSGRGKLEDAMRDTDMLITTYGILRREADQFEKMHWNYVILDEAQAIKNYKSQTATAVCGLHGRYRLSLTGTPIENNLMELWSHMQFLNPSLLGTREQFSNYLTGQEEKKAKNEEGDNLIRLQKLVYPFILRRTKEDVLTDLPKKVEQIVYCTMGSRQLEFYNSVKEEFRRSLFDNISQKGMGGSKLKIIEGLLRLRQVACHPNLVDRNISIPSTKLKHLISSLLEVVAEGHKVLVFSQFTSMLELIVRELTKESVRFTYLDGQTRDRQERVKAFQSDPTLSVFLISLKAGGTGLNLTAADYVFLYDPWWNPATEQQAVDRAHRIGQTNKVFTYRLITKDTVEEKVLELQQKKRDIVKGVLTGDNEFVKKLSKNDIEYLFN